MLLKKRHHSVIEQLGTGQRGFALVEFDQRHLADEL
jgi:hypothetical protein